MLRRLRRDAHCHCPALLPSLLAYHHQDPWHLRFFLFFCFFQYLFDWAGSWLQQVGSFSCGMPRSIIIIIIFSCSVRDLVPPCLVPPCSRDGTWAPALGAQSSRWTTREVPPWYLWPQSQEQPEAMARALGQDSEVLGPISSSTNLTRTHNFSGFTSSIYKRVSSRLPCLPPDLL